MGFFGFVRNIARLGAKLFHHGGRIGTKASTVLRHANKIPVLASHLGGVTKAVDRASSAYAQGKQVYDSGQRAYSKGKAVYDTSKELKSRGMSLLRGDLSQAHELMRGGHNVMKASQSALGEAKNTIEKAKKAKGSGFGLKYV
jgi:hypothetical protein